MIRPGWVLIGGAFMAAWMVVVLSCAANGLWLAFLCALTLVGPLGYWLAWRLRY